jgi:spore coat protein U-like protein
MLKKVALAALMAAVVSTTANAGTQSGTFTVSATLNPTCTIDTTSAAYNFGTIGATNSTYQNATATGQLVLNCSIGTSYAVTLASSNATGGPVATGFNMANGGQLMSYRLYPNAFANAAWDDTGVSANASGTGTAVNQTIYVLGEIPQQTPSGGVWNTGAFTDTVTATVTY